MSKNKFKKSVIKKFNNQKVIVNIGNDTIIEEKILAIDDGLITTESDIYPLDQARKFYNQSTGSITYVFSVDFPDKVKLENLNKLKRSVVLNNITQYEADKNIPVTELMLFVLLAVSIIF